MQFGQEISRTYINITKLMLSVPRMIPVELGCLPSLDQLPVFYLDQQPVRLVVP